VRDDRPVSHQLGAAAPDQLGAPGSDQLGPHGTGVVRGSVGVVSPTREDPLVAGLSAVVGGPAGTRVRAGRHGWWTAVRVLIVLSMVVLSLGVVEKQHCRTYGWNTPNQFFHACYSDLPLMYETTGLAQGGAPYLHARDGQYLSQPVVTGLAMWAVAAVSPSGPPLQRDRWYFDLSTVLIALLVCALVALTVASTGRRRPWDAAVVALSPLLALSALVSLDLLGVTLAAAGLLAWGRSRPALAGVLLGLAAAARTYPLLLLAVLALLALRTGRWADLVRTVAAAALTALAVLLPWVVVNLDGVTATYRSWRSTSAGYGSLWLLPQTTFSDPGPRWLAAVQFGPTSLSAGAVTMLSVLGVVVALVAGGLLVLAAGRRPRVAQVAFVVVAVVVLTGKSWPVQTSLWLLPLAALARPRWRDQLVWMSAEALYFVMVWLYVAAASSPDRALPGAWYSLFVLLRAAGLLWLVVAVVRDVLTPARDVVRADGEDDPLGGPFRGADDAVVVRFV
jgi:uncharacterized membrane protein